MAGGKVGGEERGEGELQTEITRLMDEQAEVKQFLDTQDVSACNVPNFRKQAEAQEEGGIRAYVPKKRVVMFSAFLACLSCIIILCNLIISFANDILRDDAFLDVFKKYLKDQTNENISEQ